VPGVFEILRKRNQSFHFTTRDLSYTGTRADASPDFDTVNRFNRFCSYLHTHAREESRPPTRWPRRLERFSPAMSADLSAAIILSQLSLPPSRNYPLQFTRVAGPPSPSSRQLRLAAEGT
jgi:hypothetical protein